MSDEDALRHAIEAAGGKTALARALGITYQAIDQWRRVPALRVLDVEAATGGRVTRHALRPEIYGPEPTHISKGEAA